MAKDTHPSYFTCVAEILSKSETPLSVDTLVSRIKMQRPVGSGVRSAVYQAISRLYQAIPVAPGRFGWFSCLLKDQYFRHSLSGHEVKKGDLLLDELEHAIFFPQFFQTHQPDVRLISIALMGGPTLQAHAKIDQDTWTLRLGQAFVKWLDQSGGTVQDDLLIWVKDATRGEYGMRLQPKESRQEDLIRERNIVLARAAEQIVGGDRKDRDTVPVWELAAALIGRTVYSFEVPPDDLHFVLHEYSNLQLIDDSGYTNRRQDEAAGSVASHSRRRLSSRADMLSFHEFLREFILNRSDGPLAEFLNDEDVFDISPSELEQSEHFPSDVAPETCKAYQTYLRALREVEADTSPLDHMEFHLLEAELEMLVSLEQEFGSLLLEQEERKFELADRLFIDLDLPFGGDWDQDDLDDLPFWNR